MLRLPIEGAFVITRRILQQSQLIPDSNPTISNQASSTDTNDSASDQAAKVVLVLGMHRSGTSAISGALAAMGFHPGDQLIAPVTGVNDQGFFEDERVVAANDAVLHALGRDWRLPIPLADDWPQTPAVASLRPQIRAQLTAQQQHALWLLKDPRLCMLLPLWVEELTALGIEPRVVMIYRSPGPVANSLAARDNLPLVSAHQLWLTNNLAAEAHSRALPRYLVHYEQLVNDPAGELNALASWLGYTGSVTAAVESINATARHHQPMKDLNAQLPLVQRLADLFEQHFAFPPSSALDEINDELQQALEHTRPLILNQWQVSAQLEQDFGQALEQLSATNNSVQDYEAASLANAKSASDAHDAVVLAQQQLAQKEGTIEALTASNNQLAEDFAALRARTAQLVGHGVLAEPILLNANAGEPGSSTDNAYEGVINLEVENNSHTRVIRYLAESNQQRSLRLLEVGCSSGYFGQALQAQGHEVWGIETNQSAARTAATRLHRVFCGSIEAFFLDEQFDELRFDAILFGDVLEHLLNPVAVLQASAQRLTQQGSIIASLPNIAHERARMMLFEGRWEYSATGIMDNTHLRFYTRDTIVELFSAAELAINRLSSVTLTGDAVGIRIEPGVEERLAGLIEDKERHVFQYVVQAVRPPLRTHISNNNPAALDNVPDVNNSFLRNASHKILCLPPLPNSSLYTIRLGEPMERLTELFGGEVRLGNLHNCPATDIDWADTIVFQREANEPTLELIRRLRRLGKRVVFDIDDLLLDVPDYLAVHEHCVQMRPALEAVLREVDAVSVSTEPLAQELQVYNDRVFTTPNYAWSSHTRIDQVAKPNAEAVRVIIASSDSVRVDFLVEALLQLSQDENLDLDLVAIGPPGIFLREAGVSLSHIDNMPHSQFKAFLASRPNTIALIPLDDNKFNRCKSAIKYFDYALAGVPCICSDVIPYRPVIEPGETGLLCANTQQAWVSAVRSLVQDPVLRTTIATRSLARVLEAHNLNATAYSWHNMLATVAFPEADPDAVAEHIGDPYARSPAQLLRGTVRHLAQPASYASAWRIFREQGLRGLREKWKLVF